MIEGFEESEMRDERYQAILAAYGADPKRWPEAERAAAMRVAAASADPANRDEGALDALLGAYAAAQSPADDEAAMARLLSAMNAAAPASVRASSGRVSPLRPVKSAPRKAAISSWFGDRRMMAAGFAFAALAGLAIGFTDGGGLTAADAADELVVSYALAEG